MVMDNVRDGTMMYMPPPVIGVEERKDRWTLNDFLGMTMNGQGYGTLFSSNESKIIEIEHHFHITSFAP
jgi:hypothetical protein